MAVVTTVMMMATLSVSGSSAYETNHSLTFVTMSEGLQVAVFNYKTVGEKEKKNECHGHVPPCHSGKQGDLPGPPW